MVYYDILSLSSDAEELEQLGTKEKFWFTNAEDGSKYLFKVGRPNTGENWAEVVAAKMCELLNIPHAEYSFAKWRGKDGVVTKTFVPADGRLVHGNEILAKIVDEYPEEGTYHVRKHTIRVVSAIMKSLPSLGLPIGSNGQGVIQNPHDLFVGYIMLDAWIGNPDRHHENWGIVSIDEKIYLAPTYDHASGFGCRESDENKEKRLQTKDERYSVAHFVKKAQSPFYGTDNNTKPLSTYEAFYTIASTNKKAALCWLDRLENIQRKAIEDIFSSISPSLISGVSVEFAIKMLEENSKRLLELKKGFPNA